jgi:hypothetical protein
MSARGFIVWLLFMVFSSVNLLFRDILNALLYLDRQLLLAVLPLYPAGFSSCPARTGSG